MLVYIILAALLGAAIALAIYIFLHKRSLNGKKEEILEQAELEGENIKKEKIFQAKEKYLQLKSEHEQYVSEKNSQIRDTENRLKQKENSLNQKNEDLSRKIKENESLKQSYMAKSENAERKIEEYDKLIAQANRQLEAIAGMSAAEAKNVLMENMKAEARTEAQAYINDTMDEARLNAAKEAKRIVINTIQRTATETAIENAVTTFPIENDEIKGRIIGREGRNIRALEAATGVEIVVDDTPDAILLSAFDPVRREVARLALHQLVIDGRIHPARIEEVVAKVQKQLEEEILETGKRTCIDLGIHGMNIELVKLIGRMKYRSSYGQNLLQHSKEVANLCATMAAELGLNPKAAKRAGLLHDIGKVPETEPELPHAILGMKLAEKYKENLPWYWEQIHQCTYRQYSTGFFFGKPSDEGQIYDESTYEQGAIYLGICEEGSGERAIITQKNKFSVGDEIIIMKPDGRDIKAKVLEIIGEDGKAKESCPHPKEKLSIQLDMIFMHHILLN